jgi:hypothetical protein
MSEDGRHECDHLFMAAAPFVRAEQDAKEALVAARAAFRVARKDAAVARAAWVDFLFEHDHPAVCLGRGSAAESVAYRAGSTAE